MQCFCVSQHTASFNKIRTHQTDMRETKVKSLETLKGNSGRGKVLSKELQCKSDHSKIYQTEGKIQRKKQEYY